MNFARQHLYNARQDEGDAGVSVEDDDDEVNSAISTLAPLPPVLKHGLAAVSAFGFLSFITCVALLFYLLYKLVRWTFRPLPASEGDRPGSAAPLEGEDGTTGTRLKDLLPDEYVIPSNGGGRGANNAGSGSPFSSSSSSSSPWSADVRSALARLRRDPPNQFLVLILNLLLADIQQALAFLLNVTWVARDAVEVGNSLCWAQGWFVSTGDLSSSVFISLIAVHTYLGVVRGYRMPTWAFYVMIAAGWTFNYLLAILGVIITRNGADEGGLYVRASAWCWMNAAYQDLRLVLHYLWIFVSLAFTTTVYALIFVHIQSLSRRDAAGAHTSSRSSSRSLTGAGRTLSTRRLHPHIKQDYHDNPHHSPGPASGSRSSRIFRSVKQQTFLLYPLIYVTCTTPLAAGRVATMAGATPSLAYFCLAGAMIASNGWLDVLLYATTRRSIVFSDDPASQEMGLETFAFMRTPPERRFGNVVYVAGGADAAGMNPAAHGSQPRAGVGAGRETTKESAGSVGMDVSTTENLDGSSKAKARDKKRLGSLGKLTRLRGEGGSSQVSLRGEGEHGGGSGVGSSSGAGNAPNGMTIQMETVTSVVVEVEDRGRSESNGSGRKASMASDEVSIASRL